MKEKEDNLTQSYLKQLLDYNPLTGLFVYKEGFRKGRKAGSNNNGYKTIQIKGINYQLHRLAWLYIHGDFPKQNIDHINRIKDDNRIENLRDVSTSVNARNCNLRVDNTSGHKGVTKSICGNRWLANIKVDGKYRNLGRFKDIIDAIKARKEAELIYNY